MKTLRLHIIVISSVTIHVITNKYQEWMLLLLNSDYAQWRRLWRRRKKFQQEFPICNISTGIPNLGVWSKKRSNWTSGVGVGQKNPTMRNEEKKTESLLEQSLRFKTFKIYLIAIFAHAVLKQCKNKNLRYWFKATLTLQTRIGYICNTHGYQRGTCNILVMKLT